MSQFKDTDEFKEDRLKTVESTSHQPQSSIDIITKLVPEKHHESQVVPVISDILEQTKDIHQAIANLHEDVLRIQTDLHSGKINDYPQLSPQDRAILQLAAESLIQAIRSAQKDEKSMIPSMCSIDCIIQYRTNSSFRTRSKATNTRV